MEIENKEFKYPCFSCSCKSNSNKIVFYTGEEIVLCDECLQELNRKIVDHLAEKNL